MSAALDPDPARNRHLQVLIIGAGFGGIAAAIELRGHGVRDVRILEKGEGLGGTWLYNSYPGAACDVPSHLYSYSFEKRLNWSRLCSTQPEILSYLQEVSRAHGIDDLITPNTTVTSCSWDPERCRWTVTADGGESHEADMLIVATGQLDQPARPSIPGADSFAGHSFHSAEWDHDYDLSGRRVAVIGTGASAVQFVPEIAREVSQLTVFQRTGNWFMPRRNRPYPTAMKAAVAHMPWLQELRRRFVFQYTEGLTMTIRHPRTLGRVAALRSAAFMRSQLRDPDIRRRVWPDYQFGCKRVIFSSYFLPALQRPNVTLETEAITEFSERGPVTADGREHEVDCVIWATGFRTNDFMFPMQITGEGGVSLRERWSGGAHAHLGMCVPGFPNMFVMYGPNTNTSGGSIIVYLEAQASYIRQAAQEIARRRAGAIDVLPEVEAASDRALQARFTGTAWTECDSWYRDEHGRIVANWPGYMREYLEQTAQIAPEEFRFAPLPDREPATSV